MKKPPLSPEAAETALFALLAKSAAPVKRAELVAGGSKAVREAALAGLLQAGRLVNLGTLKSPAFLAAPVDFTALAATLIMAAAPSQPSLVALAKLKKIVKFKALYDHVIPGAGRLVEKKQALLLQSGRSTYLLHLGPIRELLRSDSPVQHAVAQKPATANPDVAIESSEIQKSLTPNAQGTVAQAYDQLTRLMGTPNVPIACLVQNSGLPLGNVLDFLRTECFAYRAVPTRGEPSLATPEERKAALVIGGESYYLIRLDR